MNVAILAGGDSRRMGRDKADLPWRGSTVLGHLVGVVRAAECRPLVVGRRLAPAGVTALEDQQPGQGPLGGLVTALTQLRMDLMLIACDLPLLDAELIGWLRDQRSRAALHGLAVICDGEVEPCFSLYRPSVLELARERLASGKRSLHGLIEAGRFGEIELPDAYRRRLRNVNTPEDWVAIGGEV
jgi:molybdopterin-guanine dinucleotide biosynthesis protein A